MPDDAIQPQFISPLRRVWRWLVGAWRGADGVIRREDDRG